MNLLLRHTLTTLGLSLALACAPASAASTGLDGWLPLGDVSRQGGALVLSTALVGGGADEPGNLSGLPAELAGALETAAGLTPLALDLSALDYATEGSIALRSLAVQAGDVLRLHWSFSSQDALMADHAFALIDGQVFTLATTLPATPGAGTLVHAFSQAGTVQLGAGVVDTGDFVGVSTLRITGFEVSAVPEPALAGLWLAGLGLLAGVARQRRQRRPPAHTA